MSVSSMPVPAPNDPPTPASAHERSGLVERARLGDVAAFETLVSQHLSGIRTLAFAFTGDSAAADDLAQDALLKAYRAIRTFRFQCSFSTWLYAIVKNAYLDARKSRAEQARALEESLNEARIHDMASEDDPEDRLSAAEMRQALYQAIREVPLRFRLVLVFADVQGFEYDQISAILSLPVGTVKSRLARGRECLRGKLCERKGGRS
jgi:RNA polymerase sigma-70 factor, ECF subfamily